MVTAVQPNDEFLVQDFIHAVRIFLEKEERDCTYVARHAGVSLSVVTTLLRGEHRNIRVETFLRICAVIKTDPVRFMKRKRIFGWED